MLTAATMLPRVRSHLLTLLDSAPILRVDLGHWWLAYCEVEASCFCEIGAERGVGRLIIESEARAEASGMMVAVIVLMLVGVALSAVIWRLQAYLLRWQQHNMAE